MDLLKDMKVMQENQACDSDLEMFITARIIDLVTT
jgi:hypothetical protein